MAPNSLPVFPNYLQLRERSRVPARWWDAARLLSVALALGMAALLLLDPQKGLLVFWRLTVPVLPLLFLIAPGIWRNACPLAAFNQAPRRFNFSRALNPPNWWKEYGFVIGFSVFFLAASSRKWLFNSSGTASAVLIVLLLAGAFLGGVLFKGKSGWCSSICPLYPIQRLYNQTPFLTIANNHCDPCVGCTKNCYDFNPGVAYIADMYDDDKYYSSYRKFFAAAMPGFILAFFSLPNPPQISIPGMYAGFALYMLGSVGLFFVLDAFLKVSTHKITGLYAAAAFNLFYWFGVPGWLDAVGSLGGVTFSPWLGYGLNAAILTLSLVWLVRTYRKEPRFLNQALQQEETRIGSGAAQILRQAVRENRTEITFLPSEVRVAADVGRTLLEIAESNQQKIEAGCRMGMCGADPVYILEGMDNLSVLGADERGTLERLGLGENARLACMCRVKGSVSVSLERPQGQTLAAAGLDFDTAIRSIVVVGNGIAGVTAADYIRRRHPQCEIHLVGREKHPLYNRMAINRLIYGRSAMEGLYLQPADWYEERRITCWLNTQVVEIDRQEGHVHLATGEKLDYDRLILASGSSSAAPPVPGFGAPGTFVLREAEDAMEIRAYAQRQRCRQAVVAGGGLLGLEAAYALHKLGLNVAVLERGEWLLRRQLDRRGSYFLRQYLEALGLNILAQVEVDSLQGVEHIQQVTLKDGRALPCDLFLMAVGIRSNTELAQAAGLAVGRGVKVDAGMRTVDPHIFAAGDVCEFDGQVMGLWPVAVDQARIAAINALGGEETYRPPVPVTALKVVGVELTSMGSFDLQEPEATVIVQEDLAEHRYRKLVIVDGKIVGAILLGYPLDTAAVTAAVKSGRDVSGLVEELRQGRWEGLGE